MSIIRAIKHRLGLSVTPANNFVLTAEADNGTMKLARESGQDIMTVDAAGKAVFPQNFDKLIGLAVFDGGLTGTNAPISGFGVTSVTRNSAGNYTINLSSTYSNNSHIISAIPDAGVVQAPQWISATASSINIGNYNQAGAPTDAARILMTIHRIAP
jgi:hypothetical protein